MAENTTPESTAQESSRQVMLQRIYVKDCSFESPRSPTVFDNRTPPEITVNMQSNAQVLENGNVEVVLQVTAEAQLEGRTVFLVEVQQAGLFTLTGFSEEENAMLIASYCPSILFPYLREVVSSLTIKGGMAPLILQPVNFDALHAQQQAAAQTADNAD